MWVLYVGGMMNNYAESTTRNVEVVWYDSRNNVVTFKGTDENGDIVVESVQIKKSNIIARVLRKLRYTFKYKIKR